MSSAFVALVLGPTSESRAGQRVGSNCPRQSGSPAAGHLRRTKAPDSGPSRSPSVFIGFYLVQGCSRMFKASRCSPALESNSPSFQGPGSVPTNSTFSPKTHSREKTSDSESCFFVGGQEFAVEILCASNLFARATTLPWLFATESSWPNKAATANAT